MLLLVDTNVVSELMRPRPNRGVQRWRDGVTRFALSVITVGEVVYGFALTPRPRLELAFDELVRNFCDVLPITDAVARRAAELRAAHRRAGATRSLADMLIAASAHENKMALVTRNEDDFAGCGIRVVNPFA